MILLFENAGANGSTELKALLGFIDADIKFSKIKPDIITATTELIQLIGQPMYDEIVLLYTGPTTDAAAQHRLYLTRYAVAVRAYGRFVPNNDVAHTAMGRKMRQDENEKQAFEWMLNRDNQALERRYYKALDNLLLSLEGLDSWKQSEAYKGVKKLFLNSTDQFDEYFMIESRLILIKLEPGIRKCEREHILPRIGKGKFDALKALLQAGTEIIDETDLKLLELIREACVYYSMAWAMIRLSVTIFPEGVLQAYTSDRDTINIKRPAAKMETQAARQAFTQDADAILVRIEELVAPVPVVVPGSAASVLPEIISGLKFLST